MTSADVRSHDGPAGRSTAALLICLLLVAIARFFLSLNLPLRFQHTAMYDDAHFMKLGMSLAAGRWLGHFDQLTLIKGPGYPAFLALTGWSGLPLTATHGLFQLVALAMAGWAVWRLTSSRTIGAIVFVVLAADPAGFLGGMQRVFRDQIYWAQCLAVFSLLSVLLLDPPRARNPQMIVAAITGLLLGWTWLTREEGVWLLPGLALLVAGAWFLNRNEAGRLRALAANVAIVAAMFVALNAAFMLGNRIAYGYFEGVDFKEHNFVAALDALQSVDVGPVTPFVAISAAGRAAVANISPTFRPLADSLARGSPMSQKWGEGKCNGDPLPCGEIPAGWFGWALRDAAAENGFYRSARIAAENYGQIAHDIAAACSDGRLRCRYGFISYMPAVSTGQWLALPSSLLAVAESVALLNAEPGRALPSPVTVARDAFERYWSFLNYPRITGEASTASGWYHDSQSAAWPIFKVFDENGEEVAAVVTRTASPDLQKAFSDDRAGANRWEIQFYCPNLCVLSARTDNGPELRLPIVRDRPNTVSSGTATLYLDSASYAFRGSGEPIALGVQAGLVRLYRVAVPFLLGVGFLAAFAAIAFVCTGRAPPAARPILLLALAAWLLVLARIGLLGLMDISVTSGSNLTYTAPANYLAAMAAILSVAALFAKAQPGAGKIDRTGA